MAEKGKKSKRLRWLNLIKERELIITFSQYTNEPSDINYNIIKEGYKDCKIDSNPLKTALKVWSNRQLCYTLKK